MNQNPAGATSIMRQKDIRPAPAEIEYKGFKFLITDRPSDQTINAYIQPSYKTDELTKENIEVHDLGYDDGTFPPHKIVEEWFKVLKKQFNENPDCCVAVHCVAGLGRAPVMVALALIELGLKKRRGAINAKQLAFLEKYRPKSRLKAKNGHKNSCCVQ
nr:unnamed protein product [Callosobruchus chinensis]